MIYDGPLPRRPDGWRYNPEAQPGAIDRHTAELSRRYGIDLTYCADWLRRHPEQVAVPHVWGTDPETGEGLGDLPFVVLAVRIYDPNSAQGWKVALVAGRNSWTVGFWGASATKPGERNRAAAELLVRLAEDGLVQRSVLARALVPDEASSAVGWGWRSYSPRRTASIMRDRIHF